MIDAIRAGVPDYSQPVDGAFGYGRNLGTGVEQALREFASLIEDPDHDRSRSREVFLMLGRGEAAAGRSLESLLRAYRVGARAGWSALAEEAQREGLGPEAVATLAESMFAFVDELSAVSAEGYADEQAQVATESERARQRLIRLLVDPNGPDEGEIELLAGRVGWTLPRSVGVLICGGDEGGAGPRLPEGSLTDSSEDGRVAIVPDPSAPGRRAEIAAAIGDGLGILGPEVEWRRAAFSAARARIVGDVAAAGVVAGAGLVVADEHLAALIVHRDQAILGELAERVLSPLDGESARSRRRLLETLAAWLDHQGVVSATAGALFVHAQTVRYRIGRLRELFGESLDDPEFRLSLMLALRAPGVGRDAEG